MLEIQMKSNVFVGEKLTTLIKEFLAETKNIQISRNESNIIVGEFMIMVILPNVNYAIQNKVLLNWYSKKNNNKLKAVIRLGDKSIIFK